MPTKAMAKNHHIVISGYYGSNNAGDEAMLAAILEGFRQDEELEEHLEISVISTHPQATQKMHGIKAISWLSFFDIFREILHADLLLSGGGSLLQNVTSKRSLYYYLAIVFLAKILHKKVMLFAQGIGPIHGSVPRFLTKKAVNTVDAITVRDAFSKEELSSLGIKIVPRVTSDPVLTLSPEGLERGKNILLEAHIPLSRPILGVSVRAFGTHNAYKEEIAHAISLFARTYAFQIVFLPMQCPEDIRTAREIARLVFKNNKCFLLEEAYSTAEILSIIGNFSLVLSVRLHALIFAAIMSVPLVGISYDPKIDRFLASLGDRPVGNLTDVKSEDIFKDLEAKWFNRASFRSKNKVYLEKLHNLSKENIHLLKELLF